MLVGKGERHVVCLVGLLLSATACWWVVNQLAGGWVGRHVVCDWLATAAAAAN